MRLFALVAFLAASTCWAQAVAPNSQQAGAQSQPQSPAPSQSKTITVPAGTRIALTLASPIASKSARAGSAIRAATAFPIAVGTQLAIPVGTYVEGVIDKVTKRDSSGRPGLQMHFTRMLFANGYTVTLDGATSQTAIANPGVRSPNLSADSYSGATGNAMFAQQAPTPPPLPRLGPSPGVVAGAAAGAVVAAIVAVVLFHRRGGNSGAIVYDTGWQFELVLQNSVSLDAASVAAAVASPSAQ